MWRECGNCLNKGQTSISEPPEGETALFRALQYGTACDCLPDILAAKPDETIRNTYGRTAWECAKLYGPLHGSGLTIEDLRNMPFAEIEENDAST